MIRRSIVAILVAAVVAAACGGDAAPLTIYSGRSEELVAPLIEQFSTATGIEVEIRYADSAELAATILEEGDNSPADVFFAQDPASLGTVKIAGLLSTLDEALVASVPARFADIDGAWVGVSGRARVVVYDSTKVDAATLPDTEDGFTDPDWLGRVAIAPTNGSFLAFVAAKILLEGEEAATDWLRALAAGGAPTFENNAAIVAAVDDGQVDAGLVNHYYLFRRIDEEGADVVAANHFLTGGSAASLVMPAGAGILASSDNAADATRFIEFLLSEEAQRYFADETFEYPLIAGVEPSQGLPPLDSLTTPELSLSDLATVLDRATDLVAEAGLL